MPFDEDLQAEVERSQRLAARLLDTLSIKLRIEPTVRQATQFVRSHPIREAPHGIGRFAQTRPLHAITLAVIAGYLAGRVFRRD